MNTQLHKNSVFNFCFKLSLQKSGNVNYDNFVQCTKKLKKSSSVIEEMIIQNNKNNIKGLN